MPPYTGVPAAVEVAVVDVVVTLVVVAVVEVAVVAVVLVVVVAVVCVCVDVVVAGVVLPQDTRTKESMIRQLSAIQRILLFKTVPLYLI
jgi:hypothetical protein